MTKNLSANANANVPALAVTFMDQASQASANGDLETAIAAVQATLCVRDLPNGYRQDAAEIMTLLMLDFMRREHP